MAYIGRTDDLLLCPLEQPVKRRYVVTRSRKVESNGWPLSTSCGFGFLMFLAQVLLWGCLGLVLYWVFWYRGGIAWQDDFKREFNLHPVLMVGGFIFIMGQSILVYRLCRCCRKIYTKLWHTILHLLVMPAAAIATVAVFDSHNLASPPIPNLYSLHSWLGLGVLGLFGLQFVVGFFSFLVLLCCEKSTAAFRASLLPLHQHFGLAAFWLSIAAAVTGLTEKAVFTLKDEYKNLPEEALVINVLGVSLVVTGVVVGLIVRHPRFKRSSSVIVNDRL